MVMINGHETNSIVFEMPVFSMHLFLNNHHVGLCTISSCQLVHRKLDLVVLQMACILGCPSVDVCCRFFSEALAHPSGYCFHFKQ